MGLLGPNGAGKTTLIKILSTLISPDSGHGSIAGLPLNEHSLAIRNKIGLVSTNDRTFYWRLTGFENLIFFATLYNLTGVLKKKRIEQVLELTDMQDKAHLKFMTYSAGQKQRLSIARALLSQPDILFLDEATTSLDPIATRRLLDFIRETLAEKHKTTIVWCTHNLHEADEICDDLTILHRGKVLNSGSKKEFKTLLKQKVPYSFTVDSCHHSLQKQDDFHIFTQNGTDQITCHITIEEKNVPLLIQEMVRDGIKIFGCAPLDQALETVFSELITTQNESLG